MTFNLLNLPSELIIRILSHLGLFDLLLCRRICKGLNSVCTESVRLEYQIEMELAGVEDNPDSAISASERLKMLRNREAGLEYFQVDFRKEVPIPLRVSGIYDLTGGIYLLGDHFADGLLMADKLNILRLPSNAEDNLTWSSIRLDHRLIDIGLALAEHDLIAVVTRRIIPSDPSRQAIEILFYKMSDGSPHPDAKESIVSVLDESSNITRYSLSIEIVGRNLVLLVTHPVNDGSNTDYVFVVDWKAGAIKVRGEIDRFVYHCVAFVSPDVVLIANDRDGSFDFFRIPSQVGETPAPFRIFHTLLLPALNGQNWIQYISLRAEPNPYGPDSRGKLAPEFRTSPFGCKAEDAIFLINVNVVESLFNVSTFTIIVHRRALLDILPASASSEDEEGPIVPVPWSGWGPPITRWLSSNDITIRWITTSCGQRYARMSSNGRNDGSIHILNFNPFHVRKLKHALANPGTEKPSFRRRAFLKAANVLRGRSMSDSELSTLTVKRKLVSENDDAILSQTAFSERIESRLPYVETVSKENFDYDAVLLDEERIIGVTVGADSRERSIEILHFGGNV